jgi:hypothetical protein
LVKVFELVVNINRTIDIFIDINRNLQEKALLKQECDNSSQDKESKNDNSNENTMKYPI